MQLNGNVITLSNCVYVMFAHQDKQNKQGNFKECWDSGVGETVSGVLHPYEFPIVVFHRHMLKERYGPTFGALTSFLLTYVERNSK